MTNLEEDLNRLAELTATNMMHTTEPLFEAAFLIIVEDINDLNGNIELPFVTLSFQIKELDVKSVSLMITTDGYNWQTLNTMELQGMCDLFFEQCRKQAKDDKYTEDTL